MDEFADALLTHERVCDIILPRLIKRTVLEESKEIGPRRALLLEVMEGGDIPTRRSRNRSLSNGSRMEEERWTAGLNSPEVRDSSAPRPHSTSGTDSDGSGGDAERYVSRSRSMSHVSEGYRSRSRSVSGDRMETI